MLAHTKYHSKFFKSERRSALIVAGRTVFTTDLDDNIIIKDIFLTCGSSMHLDLAHGYQHIILPVVGKISVNTSSHKFSIASGQLYAHFGPTDYAFIAENPFIEDTVNYLLISVKNPYHPRPFHSGLFAFDIVSKNYLTRGPNVAKGLSVGIYDSRTKDCVACPGTADNIFAYVINGSFEVQDRLMEYRDALMLWEHDKVDFKALSETAIILFIQCSNFK